MNPSAHSSTNLALLRGINVGGKNMLPMKDLAGMFTEAGCRGVRTYIQSGNVVFDADAGLVKTIPTRIAQQIEKRFGMRIPVLLRTAAEMSATARDNPFIEMETNQKLLYVFFLAELPDKRNVENLDADRSPPDSFRVHGREIYLRLPNGAARTRLTNAWFDAKLATISTARNWRTVLTLTQLMRDRLNHPAVSRPSTAQ